MTGDRPSMFAGDSVWTSRWTATWYPPLQDTPGYPDVYAFGSVRYAGGFNMAFCDGSVRSIGYSIDADVHRCLGNRKDGQVIDTSKF